MNGSKTSATDVKVDRFLCGKTLMKKLRVVRTHGGDGSRNSQSNPLKSTHRISSGEYSQSGV